MLKLRTTYLQAMSCKNPCNDPRKGPSVPRAEDIAGKWSGVEVAESSALYSFLFGGSDRQRILSLADVLGSTLTYYQIWREIETGSGPGVVTEISFARLTDLILPNSPFTSSPMTKLSKVLPEISTRSSGMKLSHHRDHSSHSSPPLNLTTNN